MRVILHHGLLTGLAAVAAVVSPDGAYAAMRARSFGDLSFGISDRSHEVLGVGLGAELTRARGDALEYGARLRFEWADHLSGTLCNDDGSGCTKETKDVAALLLIARARRAVGVAGSPVMYIAGVGGFVNTRSSTDVVSPGPKAFESASSDQALGFGADVGLEFSQSNRWRGFLEVGVLDIDGFNGFAPALSLRSGAVYEWR